MADTIYRSPNGAAALDALYAQQLAAWPTDYETRVIATSCGQTHVVITGDVDAPPLLLFHDWGGSAANLYLHFDLERLSQRYRLYLPDTVGQPGRSAQTRPRTGADYGMWANDIANALGLEATFVAGWAGGGELALRLAASALDRVIRAFVIAPTGLSTPRADRRILTAQLPLRLRPSHQSARRYVRAISAATQPVTPAHEHHSRALALAAKHTRRFSSPPALTDAELAAIRAPVYILQGSNDHVTSAQAAAVRATATMLNVEVELIDGLAHLLTLDAPGLIERRLTAFFAALG